MPMRSAKEQLAREPLACRRSVVCQLVFIRNIPMDLLCADPIEQAEVLERIFHMLAGRNRQADVLDKFLRALILPGILKILCK